MRADGDPGGEPLGEAGSARVKASLIAAETPVASAEPCDLITVPFSPRNTPPLLRRGSMRFCSRFSEVRAKSAPIRDRIE